MNSSGDQGYIATSSQSHNLKGLEAEIKSLKKGMDPSLSVSLTGLLPISCEDRTKIPLNLKRYNSAHYVVLYDAIRQ